MTRRRILTTAALALWCGSLALAGSVVAVRAAGPAVTTFTLGTVESKVGPARSGRFDAYVPIVDWGVRARPYRSPLAVELEFRSLDRDAALSAVRSGPAARWNVRLLESELRESVDAGFRRAALAAVAGGLVGGFVAGAIAVAFGRRRRWVPVGTATGLVTSTAVVVLTGLTLVGADWNSLRQPTFYAHGSELPKLLSFSDQILTAGETYTESYDRAVAGLENLISATEQPRPAPAVKTVVLASDLHSNGFVLPVLAQYSRGKPVFFVGDFAQLGTTLEESVVPEVAKLGRPVVVVSGNHDSGLLMRALADEGVIVLTRARGVVDVDGAAVAGFEDPLERDGGVAGHVLKLKTGERVSAAAELIAWFDGLERRPQIVLVHQHGLAHALLDHVGIDGGAPLMILTGHDHHQHVDRRGAAILVDGGTVGAGGPLAIGESPAGFALLHLTASNRLQSADLVQVEPLSGEGSARRVVFDPSR
jgi:Calcineurin-like phosphoesterase superfamily domain